MKSVSSVFCFALGVVVLGSSGCIIVADGECWSCWSPTVWVSGEEQRVSLDGSALRGVYVKTHSGSVSVAALGEDESEAYVVYRPKGGAHSTGQAQAALDAIDVFVDQAPEGTYRIGWRWREPRKSSWSAQVSFDVHLPAASDVKVRTHNGGVTVASMNGQADIVTHNGSITVQSSGDRLEAETHNGRIAATFSGKDVVLTTHNGRIVADLGQCAAIDGRIVTHNGSVHVTMGEEASTMVHASTHNGGITCHVPLQESTIKRRTLKGRIGTGDGSLSINTHNGSVRIDQKKG